MSYNSGDKAGYKRGRSRSPPPWGRPEKQQRQLDGSRSQTSGQPWNLKEQTRLNQLQEDERMREWVSQEDTFVLRQAKKKAEIRVKEGRAKPIDWLTITLRVIDSTRDPLDDEIADADLDMVDPEGVFEGLSVEQLEDLETDIETLMNLETNSNNRDYWKVCCRCIVLFLVLLYADLLSRL